MRRLATLRKNEPPMKRLLIVSNRLPVTVSVDRDRLSYHPSSGGLASGIGSYLEAVAQRGQEAVWIGWPGTEVPAEREDEVREVLAREHGAQPVFIDAETMFSFYEGFCNDTLWPLFHYFPSIAAFKDRYWDDYRRVNRIFCDTVARIARPGDVIWVHDYHLLLLPRMLKERLPDNAVGFFLHIPFPSFEIFRMLPARWRDVILEGILGADLVGSQQVGRRSVDPGASPVDVTHPARDVVHFDDGAVDPAEDRSEDGDLGGRDLVEDPARLLGLVEPGGGRSSYLGGGAAHQEGRRVLQLPELAEGRVGGHDEPLGVFHDDAAPGVSEPGAEARGLDVQR